MNDNAVCTVCGTWPVYVTPSGRVGKLCARCFTERLDALLNCRLPKPWGRPWQGPPQHHRKRGQSIYLLDVIDRMREGTTTWNDGDWMLQYVCDLQRQADFHRKDNELMLHVLAKERQKVVDLREQMVTLYGKLEHLEVELRRAEEADDA